METLSQIYKWHSGIQNPSFHEEYGYMEICTRILRETLVEDRMVRDCTICFDTYSAIPQRQEYNRNCRGDSYDNAMYCIDGIDLFNRESFEKTFS